MAPEEIGHVMSESEATASCMHCGHEKLWHSLSSSYWQPSIHTNCLGTGDCQCPGFEINPWSAITTALTAAGKQ